jgi:hypothetical protein
LDNIKSVRKVLSDFNQNKKSENKKNEIVDICDYSINIKILTTDHENELK